MNTPRVEFKQRPFEIPANVEAARTMIHDGLNDAQVADRFGVSRTTVAKMRNRNGIRSNYRPGGEAADHRKVREHPIVPRYNPPPPPDPRPVNKEAWQQLPGTTPVSLIDIDPGMCKWPLGDGKPYLFCGADAGPHVYCPTHRKLSIGRGTESERVAHRAREKVPA